MANWVGATLIGVSLTSPVSGAEQTKDTPDAVKKAVATTWPYSSTCGRSRSGTTAT